MKYSQLEMEIDKDRLLQPLTEIDQQNIKGGQAGGGNDDIPDKITLDVAVSTLAVDYFLRFDSIAGESTD